MVEEMSIHCRHRPIHIHTSLKHVCAYPINLHDIDKTIVIGGDDEITKAAVGLRLFVSFALWLREHGILLLPSGSRVVCL